jgi:hypothetical protein
MRLRTEVRRLVATVRREDTPPDRLPELEERLPVE